MAKEYFDLKEKWQEIREAIKGKLGTQISDEDLDRTNARRIDLCHLLNEKCGMTEQESSKYVDQVLLAIQARQMDM